MAQDTVILKHSHVLAVNRNSYTKNGEEKVFRTGYVFLAGEQEGPEKPQMIELTLPHDHAFDEFKAFVGKVHSFVAIKDSFGGKFERYTYLSSVNEFLKAG